MPKIGALLKSLLEKAGIDITTADLKDALNLDLEMPAEAATKLETGLMTLDAAMSNPAVLKKVKAEIFNGADQRIAATLTELGLEEDDDFKGEKNTFEKISKLAKLAKAAGEKASTGAAKDKNEWAAKELEYNNQLKALKETLTTKEREFAETRENDLTSFDIKQILNNKKYIFPDEMDASLKINTALGAVNSELGKKGFSIKRNAAGALVILNKDGNPAYSDTNVALEPNNFIDGVLAQNKLLKVTESNPPGPGGNHIKIDGEKGNAAVVSEIAAQMDELDKRS